MKIKSFENGLKLVLEPIEHARSTAINIFIKSGSRYEREELSGISHFVEHLVFKGTKTRTALEIAQQMDEIGGQLNAYTTKEYTCIYALALYSHVGQAFNIITDMVLNSVYNKSDIDTERGVIIEEISMSEDNPEEYSTGVATQSIWSKSMLGAEIAGTRQTVGAITKEDIEQHVSDYYNPQNMLISICGKYDEAEILEIINNTFGKIKLNNFNIKIDKPEFCTGIQLVKKELEQTHIVLTTDGIPVGSDLRYANSIFSNILGGSSSSRLNQRIREELGLCYTVYSFSVSYINAGIFGIYTAIAHQNQQQFFDEVYNILQNITGTITEQELNRTKEQIKAGLVMGLESCSARAGANGRLVMLENRTIDEDEIIEKIDKVKLQDIENISKQILDLSKSNITVLGSPLNEEFYKPYYSV